MKVASTDAAAAAAAAVPGTGNCAPNRTTVRYSSRRSSKKLSSVLTAVVSTIIISLLLLSDTAASALPKKKKSKTPPPPKKKTSKKTFKNAKHSRVPNPPPTPPSTQPPTPPPSPTPTRPPTTSPPTTMYTACSDVCPNSSDLCAKQCAALDSCTDDIASAITPYQETWDTVLMGGIDVWTAQMLKFIAAAPYGMYMYDQDEFCEKIAEWVVDDNGYNDDRDSDVDEESIVAQCVAIGFPDTLMGSESSTGSESSRSSANTNACGAQLDKTTSPTQCFEPDASKFYNFKGSSLCVCNSVCSNCGFGEDLWAYLSHNYEFIEQGTCSQGLKYSWGTGRATGQTFAYNNACGDEVHQYQTWAGGNGNIGSTPSNDGQFLISGNILTDSDNPTVTNTMWRFQNYNPTTMGWEITNRRSGMKMSISTASEANCNMQGFQGSCDMGTTNVAVAELDTDGCNFCGWTTNANVSYPYSLYCHDGSVSTKFISETSYYNGEFWYNLNASIYPPVDCYDTFCPSWNEWGGNILNNEFCIEEVGSFQRIDIYNTTNALSTSGLKKGTYSTVANYAVKGMAFASIVFGGAGYAGASDLFGLLSLITPLSDDKTSALENLASEAATEAKLMTVTYDAATFQVVPTTLALNCEWNSFGCDYGYLRFLNQFPFRADTKSKTDYVCNTLLQEVHNYFETAFKAWNTGFLFQGLNETECDTIQYGSTNSCPTYQQIDYWTWRLGWNSINMGINGVDHQDFICKSTSYEVNLEGINRRSTASEVCAALYSSALFPTAGNTPNSIPNVQSVFESVLKILPPTLTSARTNQGTIQGSATCSNGGCDCHDPFGSSTVSNNYQCRYTGEGPNYFSYGWDDAYFSPPDQQAYYYFQDGDAQCNWPQNDYYAVGKAYYEEIQWDMLNWSYSTTNQTSALDNYETFFISTCEQVITNATAQMKAHIQQTQSNSTCSQLCANSNNTSVICQCP